MKTLIQFFIVAMFGIEICSPFFIGYLNHKQKLKKTYTTQESKFKIGGRKVIAAETKQIKDWKEVDFTDNNYSDSKTFTVKE